MAQQKAAQKPRVPKGHVYVGQITEEQRIEYILRLNHMKAKELEYRGAGALVDMFNAEVKIEHEINGTQFKIDTNTGIVSVPKEEESG